MIVGESCTARAKLFLKMTEATDNPQRYVTSTELHIFKLLIDDNLTPLRLLVEYPCRPHHCVVYLYRMITCDIDVIIVYDVNTKRSFDAIILN